MEAFGRVYELAQKKELFEEIRPIFENIDKMDKIDIIRKSEKVYASKEYIQEVLDFAIVILFEKAKKDEKFLGSIKFIEEAKEKLKQNANFDMTIDDMLFHLWEEINENYNRS